MADAREGRLDQPRAGRRVSLRPSLDADAFGRVSEEIARFFGTARYLVIQTVIVVLWIAYNATAGYFHYVNHGGPEAFDKYPFILLNLAFSTQAAYAAPLILLAQNRQSDRDKIQIEEDRNRSARAIADTEFLARELAAVRIALGDVVTRDFLRSELRAVLEDLEPGEQAAKKEKKHKHRDKGEQPDAAIEAEAAPVEASPTAE